MSEERRYYIENAITEDKWLIYDDAHRYGCTRSKPEILTFYTSDISPVVVRRDVDTDTLFDTSIPLPHDWVNDLSDFESPLYKKIGDITLYMGENPSIYTGYATSKNSTVATLVENTSHDGYIYIKDGSDSLYELYGITDHKCDNYYVQEGAVLVWYDSVEHLYWDNRPNKKIWVPEPPQIEVDTTSNSILPNPTPLDQIDCFSDMAEPIILGSLKSYRYHTAGKDWTSGKELEPIDFSPDFDFVDEVYGDLLSLNGFLYVINENGADFQSVHYDYADAIPADKFVAMIEPEGYDTFYKVQDLVIDLPYLVDPYLNEKYYWVESEGKYFTELGLESVGYYTSPIPPELFEFTNILLTCPLETYTLEEPSQSIIPLGVQLLEYPPLIPDQPIQEYTYFGGDFSGNNIDIDTVNGGGNLIDRHSISRDLIQMTGYVSGSTIDRYNQSRSTFDLVGWNPSGSFIEEADQRAKVFVFKPAQNSSFSGYNTECAAYDLDGNTVPYSDIADYVTNNNSMICIVQYNNSYSPNYDTGYVDRDLNVSQCLAQNSSGNVVWKSQKYYQNNRALLAAFISDPQIASLVSVYRKTAPYDCYVAYSRDNRYFILDGIHKQWVGNIDAEGFQLTPVENVGYLERRGGYGWVGKSVSGSYDIILHEANENSSLDDNNASSLPFADNKYYSLLAVYNRDGVDITSSFTGISRSNYAELNLEHPYISSGFLASSARYSYSPKLPDVNSITSARFASSSAPDVTVQSHSISSWLYTGYLNSGNTINKSDNYGITIAVGKLTDENNSVVARAGAEAIWDNTNGGQTSGSNYRLSVKNNTSSSITCKYAYIYRCYSNLCNVSTIVVYNSSNELFNAFKYNDGTTDYYYILDDVHNSWLTDLSTTDYHLPTTYNSPITDSVYAKWRGNDTSNPNYRNYFYDINGSMVGSYYMNGTYMNKFYLDIPADVYISDNITGVTADGLYFERASSSSSVTESTKGVLILNKDENGWYIILSYYYRDISSGHYELDGSITLFEPIVLSYTIGGVLSSSSDDEIELLTPEMMEMSNIELTRSLTTDTVSVASLITNRLKSDGIELTRALSSNTVPIENITGTQNYLINPNAYFTGQGASSQEDFRFEGSTYYFLYDSNGSLITYDSSKTYTKVAIYNRAGNIVSDSFTDGIKLENNNGYLKAVRNWSSGPAYIFRIEYTIL